MEHVTPTLAGCEESLIVQVATTLEMDDGALSLGGQLAAKVTNDGEVPVVSGPLDLSAARGTLEIELPSSEGFPVGYVNAVLYLWPDGVRSSLTVWLLDRDFGTDIPRHIYMPLEGRAPVDDCNVAARPVPVDQPLSWLGGDSLADRYPEVRARLTPSEPFEARWSSGAATSVRAELGEPFGICDDYRVRVTYDVPFGLSSADGRVSIRREARGNLWLDEGPSAKGWVAITPAVVEEAEGFAEASGISGVDFGESRRGSWHASLYLDGTESEPPMRGHVTVEGFDIEGQSVELESLRW